MGLATVTILTIAIGLAWVVSWQSAAPGPHNREETMRAVEGAVRKVDVTSKTVWVSVGLLGLRAMALELADESLIYVGDKQGALPNLQKGQRVRVAYVKRGDRKVATSIEVGFVPHTSRTAGTDPPRPPVASKPSSPDAASGDPRRERVEEVRVETKPSAPSGRAVGAGRDVADGAGSPERVAAAPEPPVRQQAAPTATETPPPLPAQPIRRDTRENVVSRATATPVPGTVANPHATAPATAGSKASEAAADTRQRRAGQPAGGERFATAPLSAPSPSTRETNETVPRSSAPAAAGAPALLPARPGANTARASDAPATTESPARAGRAVLRHLSRSQQKLIRATSPAVVKVLTPGRVSGLGFIMDPSGYIVTNHHLVAGARTIAVTLAGGRTLAAKTVTGDPLADVAVLKVNAAGLPTIRIGDSSALSVGELVIAIGEQRGRDREAAVGAVMATAAATGGQLAIDAEISPHGSGGPLVNSRGEVIGLATASAEPTGSTLAVPINRAKPLLKDLDTSGPSTGRSLKRPPGR